MIDTHGIEEAGDQTYLPLVLGQSVQIPTRMVYSWPRSKRRHRSLCAARQLSVLIFTQSLHSPEQ
jgi:hypothetical protein